MSNIQTVSQRADVYEAPKLLEIGQVGNALQGARMGMLFDGGFEMDGTETIGLTTAR